MSSQYFGVKNGRIVLFLGFEMMEKDKKKRIYNIAFVKGVIGTDELCTDKREQYAFVGRSNVGKSSIINMIAGKRVAYPSNTPGKTSEINFFAVNDESIFIVDLPGYGFAKVGTKEKEKFRKRIIWYFTESGAKPSVVFIILDARRGLTDLDEDMIEIMREEGHPFVIIVNKIDKLNQKEQSALQKDIELKIEKTGLSKAPLLYTSVKTGRGKEELISIIIE